MSADTRLRQIVRTELGVTDAELLPTDTSVGDAGTSSASRQTWMSGGAVREACRRIRDELLARAGCTDGRLENGAVVTPTGQIPLAELIDEAIDETAVFRHRTTSPLDENGQGDAHVAYAFAAHRVIVDVDVELGTIEVVEVACAQDVGKAINPLGVAGQPRDETVVPAAHRGSRSPRSRRREGPRASNCCTLRVFLPVRAAVPRRTSS